VLTSANPAQITITAQTSALVTASVFLPPVTSDPYPRWWRCDAHVGVAYRTALYGPVNVVDL
jgi:hypothetical protein